MVYELGERQYSTLIRTREICLCCQLTFIKEFCVLGTVLSGMPVTKMKMGPVPIRKRVKEREIFFDISFKEETR